MNFQQRACLWGNYLPSSSPVPSSTRTLLFDEQAKAHIQAHPDCCVINMACGLDDRFRRVDNGKIRWFNIGFPDIIDLRKELIPGNDRVTDIWMDQIPNKDHALFIAEGFLMYVTAEQAKEMFSVISERFTHTTLPLELMAQWMVDHQK